MSNSSAEPEAEAEPEGEPTTEEIIVTPVAITILGVICFLILWLVTRCQYRKYRANKVANFGSRALIIVKGKDDSEEDRIVQNFRTYQNKLSELLIITIPPVLSMIFCPLTLFIHGYLTDYLWPSYASFPNVNDAIGCFLVPAGMVYAITFAASAEQVTANQDALSTQLQNECKVSRQIMLMTNQISCLSVNQKHAIYTILQSNCLNRMQHIIMDGVDKTVNVWEILKHMATTNPMGYADKVLYKEIVNNVSQLSTLIPDNGNIHTKMNKLQWVLLESLGFFTFLGVLLINAKSYKLELAMCIITVVSITLLTTAVSDLDSPFHGFYRIDLEFLTNYAEELRNQLNPTITPPESFKEKI